MKSKLFLKNKILQDDDFISRYSFQKLKPNFKNQIYIFPEESTKQVTEVNEVIYIECSPPKASYNEKNSLICPVCFNNKRITHYFNYNCKHKICSSCAKKWNSINGNCPFCRQKRKI